MKHVIWPGNSSILCHMAKTNTFLQYLSQTARKSFEDIERLGIFYKLVW